MATRDKARNAADHAKGRLKAAIGRVRGDAELRTAGEDDQSIANLKQAGEKVKDALKN